MKTLPKASRPTQSPSRNGHGIELGDVIATAIEVEGLTARTLLQLHACFAQQHEVAFVFAKMAALRPHTKPSCNAAGHDSR